MKPLRPEVIALVAALLAAGGSWAWSARLAAKEARAAAPGTLRVGAGNYEPSGRDAPKTKTEIWPAPKAQTGGWVYDVFTPPEIFYDARTKAFSITPPEVAPALPVPVAAPFGLELRSVSQPLFRLQLVGFAGGEGNYRGLFENMVTTETFLATGGRRLPELGLVIESLEVRDTPVALPESMTTVRRVATARVRDERTGESLSLTDGGRMYVAAPVATVAASGEDATPREVREGDSFELGGARYKIEKIQLAPPAADVTKESADQPNFERRTLTPSQPAAAAPDQPAS
ncbi:MAG TPA: hypothetical protein VHE13_12025 [Opitutus sp.]|nr:hypothetical protein [Opitutus sp.]